MVPGSPISMGYPYGLTAVWVLVPVRVAVRGGPVQDMNEKCIRSLEAVGASGGWDPGDWSGYQTASS